MSGVKERDRQRRFTLKLAVLCLLLTLMAGGFWYARPVGLDILSPGMEPELIDITLTRFCEDHQSEFRNLQLASNEPGFDELLARLEELHFRRPPTNLVLQAIPCLENLTSQPKILEDGDIEDLFITLARSGPEDWSYAQLEFSIDEWSYRDFEHNVMLPLGMSQSKENGQNLGRELWDKALPSKSYLQ
ncbi:hypothetical protein OBV_46450 [Oscillibacter valericigenes Sjm18-20]|nr:hypothetical protein OBV_46450 [Oscillibacter valericigenes Sjm18-20]